MYIHVICCEMITTISLVNITCSFYRSKMVGYWQFPMFQSNIYILRDFSILIRFCSSKFIKYLVGKMSALEEVSSGAKPMLVTEGELFL